MSEDLTNAIRALAMDAVQAANSGHPGMPMGMAEIGLALWGRHLRHNPANPKWPDRDRFVLSNGHGSMLLYALLHLTGYELSMEELVRPVASAPAETSSTLSAAQESALAADPQLLGCFYLLTNGHTPQEVASELHADERLLRRWLVKLDNLRLVELRARLGARLRVHAPISWREDGPIRRTYEQQVRDEFMRSGFLAADETLHFRSAELSEASRVVLQRKLTRLTADFNELAELDRHLPSREKRSVALMMVCRPWVFSMFDGLKRR